jgi:hypothetical protein
VAASTSGATTSGSRSASGCLLRRSLACARVPRGFSGRQALLLRAVDELHDTCDISDHPWAGLRTQLFDVELIAIVRGIERRSRRVVAPSWVGTVLPIRMFAQKIVELGARRGLDPALEIARREHAPLTTEQPS